MTKIIIYSEYNLNRLYNNTMEYLHDKYHTHSASRHRWRGDPSQFALDAQATSEAEEWTGLMEAEQHGGR